MNIKKTNRLFTITEIKLRLKFGTEKNVTYIRIINNLMTTKQNQYDKTKKDKRKIVKSKKHIILTRFFQELFKI